MPNLYSLNGKLVSKEVYEKARGITKAPEVVIVKKEVKKTTVKKSKPLFNKKKK